MGPEATYNQQEVEAIVHSRLQQQKELDRIVNVEGMLDKIGLRLDHSNNLKAEFLPRLDSIDRRLKSVEGSPSLGLSTDERDAVKVLVKRELANNEMRRRFGLFFVVWDHWVTRVTAVIGLTYIVAELLAGRHP